MATRFYLRTSVNAEANMPLAEQSVALPNGTTPAAPPAFAKRDLSRTKGSSQEQVTWTHDADQNHDDCFVRMFISEAISENISAQTWTIALAGHESNNLANTFHEVCLYVWRPGTGVVGYIYDAHFGGTDPPGELASAEAGDVFTVSGAAVSGIAAGDRIILEVWHHVQQGMNTAYTSTESYGGATDVTEGTGTADAAAYIETPQNLFPPTVVSASAADSGRDWDVPFQDISIVFSAAMTKLGGNYGVGDTIPGLTVQINGGAGQAVTYRSGEDGDTWVVRVGVLVHQGDTVVIDYDRTAGELVRVADSVELADTTDAAVSNTLTKRVRVLLKDKLNAAITGAVTISINVWGDDPGDANFMSRDAGEAPANYTPSGAGLLDIEYNGAVAVGGSVFLVVFYPRWDSGVPSEPTEAFVWEHVIE